MSVPSVYTAASSTIPFPDSFPVIEQMKLTMYDSASVKIPTQTKLPGKVRPPLQQNM